MTSIRSERPDAVQTAERLHTERKQGRTLARLSYTALGTLVAYLLLWPVSIEPVAWEAPESPALEGRFAVNDLLAGVQEKIRERSGGRFYRDRFAMKSGPGGMTPLTIALVMIGVLAAGLTTVVATMGAVFEVIRLLGPDEWHVVSPAELIPELIKSCHAVLTDQHASVLDQSGGFTTLHIIRWTRHQACRWVALHRVVKELDPQCRLT